MSNAPKKKKYTRSLYLKPLEQEKEAIYIAFMVERENRTVRQNEIW